MKRLYSFLFILLLPLSLLTAQISQIEYIPFVMEYDVNSNYIQNKTINHDTYYFKSPLSVGYDVTNLIPYGNVKVKSGNILKLPKGVTIKNRFEIEKGATLTIE